MGHTIITWYFPSKIFSRAEILLCNYAILNPPVMRTGCTLGFALHKIIKDIDGNGLRWWCPVRHNNYFYCYFVLLKPPGGRELTLPLWTTVSFRKESFITCRCKLVTIENQLKGAWQTWRLCQLLRKGGGRQNVHWSNLPMSLGPWY